MNKKTYNTPHLEQTKMETENQIMFPGSPQPEPTSVAASVSSTY